MNLFGVNISWNGGKNGFVKKEYCHEAQNEIKNFIGEKIDKVHERVDKIFEILTKK